MLSFWEKQSFLNYDYIIIGSGVVGLSCAASIVEKNKKAKVLVLERGLFPTGASTKNAGFACFGSLTEILSDLKLMTENQVVNLVKERYDGLERLRKRLGDKAIDYRQYGGYELISEKEMPAIEQLDAVNKLLMPFFKKEVYALKNKKINSFGFDKESVKTLIFNQFEGQIDTGKMMKSLLRYVQERGVAVLNSCEVSHFENTENDSKVNVYVDNLSKNEGVSFSAKKLIICTNAFTNKFFPDLDISAGRGQVLITEPMKDLKLKGTFHFDEGYYYFRNYGQRVLLGGGRNLDFQGENTTEINTTEKIMSHLEYILRTIILPKQDFVIAHRWAGIMAFGADKQPIIKFHSPNILLAVRMGGMGVAIGSQVGDEVSKLV
jgi:glycine/D-amino acid oxidase-like deaminating enzyme